MRIQMSPNVEGEGVNISRVMLWNKRRKEGGDEREEKILMYLRSPQHSVPQQR